MKQYFYNWISDWVDILCGVVGVLSLGIYRPTWDMDIRFYITKRLMVERLSWEEKRKL